LPPAVVEQHRDVCYSRGRRMDLDLPPGVGPRVLVLGPAGPSTNTEASNVNTTHISQLCLLWLAACRAVSFQSLLNTYYSPSIGISQLITYHMHSAVVGLRCFHCAFLLEGQCALRSCGSPSVALQPMLCPRGLAPFYRLRESRFAQCNCVPTAKDLRFAWCQSVARKMASARWDDGACLQPHYCLAGWYGFSGLSRAVVSRLRIVSSRICCTSYILPQTLQGVQEAHS
jgi:hypothetical protein